MNCGCEGGRSCELHQNTTAPAFRVEATPAGPRVVDEPTLVEVRLDCWAPENWLTYRGDWRSQVGALMGPKYRRHPLDRNAYCTVVAARYEPDHDWGDGGKLGRTQLGLVSAPVHEELGEVISYTATELGHPVHFVLRRVREAVSAHG